MIRRVMNDWLHWSVGPNMHFGWHKTGNCWVFQFKKEAYSNCTFYTFWRFFISVTTKSKDEQSNH